MNKHIDSLLLGFGICRGIYEVFCRK